MPTLYVLDNPRRRKYRRSRRRHNPDGTFALANPRRRGRRHYRRNPDIMRTTEKYFAGFDAMEIALAAGSMVAVQKVQEMLPATWRQGFADPISAAVITAVGVMVFKREPKIAKGIGIGGGIASALKVAAHIPALNNFVSPGSLVIGRHAPAMGPMPTGAALPSGKVVSKMPMATGGLVRL